LNLDYENDSLLWNDSKQYKQNQPLLNEIDKLNKTNFKLKVW